MPKVRLKKGAGFIISAKGANSKKKAQKNEDFPAKSLPAGTKGHSKLRIKF